MRKVSHSLSRIARVFGTLSGIGGLVHGIGEVLQGNITPEGLIINSWERGPIAEHMGGEPGMTIVPNLLVTGVLTILVSTALILWSLRYVDRRHTGKVMLCLSVMMLLFGGGFGPPIMGFMAGIAGTRAASPLTFWRKGRFASILGVLSKIADLVYLVSVVNGAFLVFGSAIFPYLGIHAPDVFVTSFFFTLVTIPVTIAAGIAKTINEKEMNTKMDTLEVLHQ